MANFKPYPKKQKDISMSQQKAFDKQKREAEELFEAEGIDKDIKEYWYHFELLEVP